MRNTIDLHDCHLFRFERLYCMYQMMMITTRFNLYTLPETLQSPLSFQTLGSLDVTS